MKRDIFLLLFVLILFLIGIFSTFKNVYTASLLDTAKEEKVQEKEVVIKSYNSSLVFNNDSIDILLEELDYNSDIIVYYGDEYLKLSNRKGDVCINISNLECDKKYQYKIVVNDETIDAGDFMLAIDNHS